ncbi:MAG: 3-dehydroquinate synthase [Gemmatimonadales bacterium]
MSSGPIVVRHSGGSYPIYIEPGGLGRLLELVQEYLPGRRVALVADAEVYELYRTGRLGAQGWNGDTLTFPAGEASKSRETWTRLTDELLERGFGRDSGIVALGGGVTGDLAGFVAATYMRGLPYIQVPTTLLAMIDASVGGKTGVDTPEGKNLVGSFHHPNAVMADPLVLGSLPQRAFQAGLAEAVKHGLIADRRYFEWMETQAEEIRGRNQEALVHLIRRSVEIKAEVVSRDEREAGWRAILNAGHTVAHALEQASGFALPHGEAVALGLMVECQLAEDLGVAQTGLRDRVAQLLTRFGLPTRWNQKLDRTPLLQGMRSDKKNRDGQLHFALPADLGRVHRANGWTTAVPESAIGRALALLE